jgi:hypothetical protein
VARALPRATVEIAHGCGHVFDSASIDRIHARALAFVRDGS